MRQIVNSTKIDDWFSSTSRDAQGLLPHFVRRLINATIGFTAIKVLQIPVGDDVARRGFDGRVEVEAGHRYVPADLSVWEMGTGNSPMRKANEVYGDRTANPKGIEIQSTAFVFVTPHRWEGKDEWAKARQDEKNWREVRVLDNSDLEAWCELAPGVGRWLAQQMGVPVIGLCDLDVFRRELAAEYQCDNLSPDLLISGRDENLTQFHNWLAGDKGELDVEGESIEDVTAFVAAAIEKLPPNRREWVISRLLFVDCVDGMEYIAAISADMFVIPTSDEARRRAKAGRSTALRLIYPVVRAAGTSRQQGVSLRLTGIRRAACEQALLAMAVPSPRAARIAVESKGHLVPCLWMLARGPDTPLPWTIGQPAMELAPLMFAGQWDADSETDRAIIAKLAGRDYSEVEKTLAQWQSPNGPLVKRGPLWDWMAWDFAWNCLAPHIDQNLLTRFTQALPEVLGIPDPKLELDPEKQWMASVYKKKHPFSTALRAGLVGSLVQLALNDAGVQGTSGQAIASAYVSSLLNGTNLKRSLAWPSLAPWLPDLAEAAPEAFLRATDSFCDDAKAVNAVFIDVGIFGSSPHTFLLWALERLAWSKEHFSRAIAILGELAARDPGGRLLNRPLNSLKEILLPWFPRTSVSVEERLVALDLLYQRQAEVAWQVVCALLPHGPSMAGPTANPQWRDWKPTSERRVTGEEYWKCVEALFQRALTWAGISGTRWRDLIRAYSHMRESPIDLGNRLLAALRGVLVDQVADLDRMVIADALRDLLNLFDQPHDAEGTGQSAFATIQILQETFQPEDLIERNKWLFTDWPHIPRDRKLSYDDFRKSAHEQQLQTVQKIYTQRGIHGILALADAAPNAAIVGIPFAEIEIDDDALCALLNETITLTPTRESLPNRLRFALAYVGDSYHRRGAAWIDHVRTLSGIDWTVDALANFAWGLPAEGPIWDRMVAWGHNVVDAYWKRVLIHFVPPENAERDAERAVLELIRADRPYRALDVAAMCFPLKGGRPLPVTPDTILHLLQETPRHDPKAEWWPPSVDMLGHHVETLLDVLETNGIDTIVLANIEYLWLAVLDRHDRAPKFLGKAISTNPKIFVELLESAFRSELQETTDSEEASKPDDRQAHIAMKTYRLLEDLRTLPGEEQRAVSAKQGDGEVRFDDGKINETLLIAWVEQARALANSSGRIGVCDFQIGRLFSEAPKDSDGSWPCEPVRNIIEKLKSDRLDRGLAIGLFNRRGAHWRQPGGQQERKIADLFRSLAERVRSKWPRTAGLLSEIATNYDQHAKREDEQQALEEFE